MNGLLTVAKLTLLTGLINISSILCVLLMNYQIWDIVAAVMTLIFNVCLLVIESSNRPHDIMTGWFRHFLIICILMAGSASFFWFFHIIHNLAIHWYEITVAVSTSCSAIVSLIVSIYLVAMAHSAYLRALLMLPEKTPLLDVTPIAATELGRNFMRLKYDSRTLENINPV
ncbi:hypothetical protein PPYR_13665 [Photinus pyralis]|uniref:Uncharacterized protein n=1 Tax=Photinus pyralis TaxID=7054 RepID=A0A5N4A9P7_PHOPY|nr:uncharacterized protein LOC116178236 [Photinus pyralis]KAB0794045.1 hypothetical protein PPYR_13665 [Photinus pyralis]